MFDVIMRKVYSPDRHPQCQLPSVVMDVSYQLVEPKDSSSCLLSRLASPPLHTIDQLASEMSSSPAPQHLCRYVDAQCTGVPEVV